VLAKMFFTIVGGKIMVQNILNQFQQVIRVYEHLNQVASDIFSALEEKNYSLLDRLNKEELSLASQLTMELKSLKAFIEEACDKKGVVTKRLQSLFPYMTAKEKEMVASSQLIAIQYEEELKNKTKMNQYVVEAMLGCSQIIIDTWVHIAKRDNVQTNRLINEEF
jgi:hypothetical protein